MKLSVIISYYKNIENLKLILKALNNQSIGGFEIIISEDDNNYDTLDFIDKNKSNYSFPIQHLNQKEDTGFRKNEMLNRAIMAAKSDFVAFIDGDCIPNKQFVKEYVKNLKKDSFMSGRAVMLSKEISEKIVKNQSLKDLNFFSLIFSGSSKVKEAIYFPFFPLTYKIRGMVGRNWGIHKQNLIDINGFDTDYVFAGVGEDVDIEWRLMANGVKRKSIKNKAIVYHIYHDKVYSEVNVGNNYKKLEEKKKLNNIKCLNGILKIK